MRYFVVSDDGNKYGPAEVETLNQWVQEGRLLPTTLLEEEMSGSRIAAQAVAGLNFPAPAPSAGPVAGPGPGAVPPGGGPPAPGSSPYGAQYQRPTATYQTGNDGNGEMIASWILGGFGLLLCCCYGWVLNIIGAVLGNISRNKGHRGGQAAMIFNIVVVVIGIVWLILARTMLAPFAQSWQQQFLHQQQLQQQQGSGQTAPPSLPGAGATAGSTAG